MPHRPLAVALVLVTLSSCAAADPPCRTPDITDACWKSMGESCTEAGGTSCLLCLANPSVTKKTAAAGCPQTPPGKVARCFCGKAPSPSPPPSPGASCIPTTASGLHKNVPCNLWSGLTFTYNVPAKCATSKCGLIVDIHGFDMDSEQENNNTAMRERGEANGYVVAQPSAPMRNWNLQNPSVGVNAILGFIDQALEAPGLNVDKNRVHLMGFSQGAFLTSGMLCGSPDRFASFVVMEGPGFTLCKQGQAQPPVLLQAGTNDRCCGGAKAAAALADLKEKWGLDTGVKIAGDGHFTRTRYNSTVGIYPSSFEFLTYDYVADYFMTGHCFPGSDDLILVNPKAGPFPQAGPFGCPGLKERAKGARPGYVIGEEAMKWFLKYPKPETAVLV